MNNAYFQFPDTPDTVLSEMIKLQEGSKWNASWSTFYDIYNNIVFLMVRNTFVKFNFLNYTEDDLKEVVYDVFVNLLKVFEEKKYVQENHKFRGFLKKVSFARTVDYIRKKYPKHKIEVESLDFVDALMNTENDDISPVADPFLNYEESEEKAYKLAQILNIWNEIKNSYEENNAIVFEMVYLQDKSIKEACEELGLPRSSAEKALSRIMKRIKKKIANSNENANE